VNDVYKINVAKTEFREAYNTGDVDRLLAVFAPSGFTDMSEDGPNRSGEQAKLNFRGRVSQLLEEYSVKFTPIVINVVVLGDTAYDYGWHEFILTPKKGGESIRKRQRYFELWKKMGSGEWKISFQINNRDVRDKLGGYTSRWFMSEEQAQHLAIDS